MTPTNESDEQVLPETIWVRGDKLEVAVFHELLRLRIDVFVVEQQCAYPELDGWDLAESTWHGYVPNPTNPAEAIAGVRLLGHEHPPRIGRVVTAPQARSRGLAAHLVHQAHQRAGGVSELAAQTYLVDWYQSLGWTVSGPSFDEDGIDHTPMARTDRS